MTKGIPNDPEALKRKREMIIRRNKEILKFHNRKLTGKFIDSDGYIKIKCYGHPRSVRGRDIYEHIIVMEQFLNRFLTDDEVVHHIDGNKTNNILNNLLLMTKKEHHTLHYKERKINKLGRFIPNEEVVAE